MGILVPGSIQTVPAGGTAATQYVFIPASPYGPGHLSPTEGFDIEVRIGDIPYPQPNSVVPPILGLPTGLSGTQLELSNSLNKVFRATPCTGCQTPASVVEGFDNSTFLDGTFVPVFGPARWNASSAPSQLAGRAISGSPTANTTAGLGTRFQIPFTPQPLNTTPAGLFSPFDASAANSGNQCGASGCNLTSVGVQNPMGGSHIMHLYEAVDLQNTKESLELIEWSPVNSITVSTTYPQYRLWCGVTNKQGAYSGAACPPPNPIDLCMESQFNKNYQILFPYQMGEPVFPQDPMCANANTMNPRKVLCNPANPYVVALQTTEWYPFPVMSPTFDYATSRAHPGRA